MICGRLGPGPPRLSFRSSYPYINGSKTKQMFYNHFTRLRASQRHFVKVSGFNTRTQEMALPKAKELVATTPVVVFSKSYCPFCVEVKQLFTKLGVTFKAIELDTESDGSDVQSALAEWTGQRTVPNVFIGGNHIGGCDSTTGLHNQGKLVPLLTSAGAIAQSSS